MNNNNIHRLDCGERQVIIIGTAHISRQSAYTVAELIKEETPDTVCVELCNSRYQAITQRNRWQDTDLIKVIREKKAFLLLSNLILTSFQKRLGQRLGIKPGEEFIRAIKTAEEVGANVHLADRDISITLARAWRLMGLWTKLKLLVQAMISMGQMDQITEKDIEEMKKKDILEIILSEMGQSLPLLKHILIDERDQFLTYNIRNAPGSKIVAVVGAGHVPGIQNYWNAPLDISPLLQTPPKPKWLSLLKWGIPLAVIVLVVLGFFLAGPATGAHMIKWWILANAAMAGIGATLAFAHPVTVASAVVSSPLTSLNPMIAAGWVAGLVELFLSKPKVRDFESLPEDIASFKGFWRNKITKVLLVVVLTNLGSSLGAFVALPLMAKALT